VSRSQPGPPSLHSHSTARTRPPARQVGTKLLATDVRIASGLAFKAMRGNTLTRWVRRGVRGHDRATRRAAVREGRGDSRGSCVPACSQLAASRGCAERRVVGPSGARNEPKRAPLAHLRCHHAGASGAS
jgi:hypothetical protein